MKRLMFLFLLIYVSSIIPIQKQNQDMLHDAILNNSSLDVKVAIRAGAQINFKKDNESPLFKAILLRKSKAVKALLECGANINISYLGKPILHYAIKGDFESALLLIKNGADFSGFIEDEKDIFTYISTHPQLTNTVMNLMYEIANRGYDINKNFNNTNLSNNAWYLALKNNKQNYISYFLNKSKLYPLPQRANPNQIFIFPDGSFWTPLLINLGNSSTMGERYGTKGGYGITHTILLNKDANINQIATPHGKKHSPLSFAITVGNWIVINQLIEKGANLKEAYELFLQHGGSPDYIIKGPIFARKPKISYINCTLLGLAIECNNKEAVKVLLNSGAHVNLPTDRFLYIQTLDKKRSFNTPFYHALTKGNSNIINFLMDNGAHI